MAESSRFGVWTISVFRIFLLVCRSLRYLHTSNMSSMKDFANIRSLFFFLRLFSGLRSLTGSVFTWRFLSLVFPRRGRRQCYKALRLRWKPNSVSSLCRSLLRYGGTLSFYVCQQLLNSVLILQWWKLVLAAQLRYAVFSAAFD